MISLRFYTKIFVFALFVAFSTNAFADKPDPKWPCQEELEDSNFLGWCCTYSKTHLNCINPTSPGGGGNPPGGINTCFVSTYPKNSGDYDLTGLVTKTCADALHGYNVTALCDDGIGKCPGDTNCACCCTGKEGVGILCTDDTHCPSTECITGKCASEKHECYYEHREDPKCCEGHQCPEEDCYDGDDCTEQDDDLCVAGTCEKDPPEAVMGVCKYSYNSTLPGCSPEREDCEVGEEGYCDSGEECVIGICVSDPTGPSVWGVCKYTKSTAPECAEYKDECTDDNNCQSTDPCVVGACEERVCVYSYNKKNPPPGCSPVREDCEIPADCQSSDTCVVGTCTEGVCEFTYDPTPPGCSPDREDCENDTDCQSTDTCVVGTCTEGVCEFTYDPTPSGCSPDREDCEIPADCQSSDTCVVGTCTEGVCEFTYDSTIPGCSPDREDCDYPDHTQCNHANPCVEGECLPEGFCVYNRIYPCCVEHDECSNGNNCLSWECNENHQCQSSPISCTVDGSECDDYQDGCGHNCICECRDEGGTKVCECGSDDEDIPTKPSVTAIRVEYTGCGCPCDNHWYKCYCGCCKKCRIKVTITVPQGTSNIDEFELEYRVIFPDGTYEPVPASPVNFVHGQYSHTVYHELSCPQQIQYRVRSVNDGNDHSDWATYTYTPTS